MAMTIAQWQIHISRLENDLAELEASPDLPVAQQRVVDLKAERLALDLTWHTHAEFNSAIRKQNDLDNRLGQARHQLKVASGEALKLQLLQARYSLAEAERRANCAIMFFG